MKKYSKYIAGIMVVFLLGCSKEFLETPPLTTTTDVTFPETEDDALLVTNAAYNMLRDWRYPGGFPLADIMSDDQGKGSEDGANPDLQLFEVFGYSAGHGYIGAWYQTLYKAIRRANIVIERVPPIDMDEDLKMRYVAEARFIRALTYFTMVRLWGDLPMVTEVVPERILPRTPVADFYEEVIIPDLEYGIDVLPEKSDYPSADLGRVTKGACKALLARVYLTLHDYTNAEKYALEVINSGQYILDPDYSRVFSLAGQFGPGSIFEIGALPDGYAQGGNQYGNTQGVRGVPNWGWGFGRPSWDLLNHWEEDDPRKDQSVIFLGEIFWNDTIFGSSLTSDTTYQDGEIIEIECYNQKVLTEDATGPLDAFGHNRRIIRYADVLLMAAEAMNENGKPGEALSFLNMVRERARGGNPNILPDITTTDQNELRNLIWFERRSELAMEQERWFDLKRQGRMAEKLEPLGFIAGKHELLPIPQQEIDLSEGALTQNPNW
jgi:hypothetical protein